MNDINKTPSEQQEEIPVLPENIPVTMPELPARLSITTMEQMKAFAGPTRERVLDIIQQQPATAKQVANRLKMAPGTINHHLQVLEAAGLAKVVARRLVRGIVAKYYTRTARIFVFHPMPEIADSDPINMQMITKVEEEYRESFEAGEGYLTIKSFSYPRARLSEQQALAFQERLHALVNEFIQEPQNPDGEVYTLFTTFFKAPPYLQTHQEAPPSETIDAEDE